MTPSTPATPPSQPPTWQVVGRRRLHVRPKQHKVIARKQQLLFR